MMKTTRYREIVQIALMPRIFPVNCYLVEEKDSLTLVDAAMPFGAKGILQTARSLGKPLARIVLTHPHTDHIGAVDRLKAEFPDLVVYLPERDAKLLTGDMSPEPGEPEGPVRGGVAKPSQLKTKPDVLLRDGDRVGSLQAVATPGHTPGHMSFIDVRSGALLAGDAFQTRGAVAVSGKPVPWFPFPAWATWNKERALDSAKRILDLKPTLLAPGHGAMKERPEAAIRRAILEAEQYLAAPAKRSR